MSNHSTALLVSEPTKSESGLAQYFRFSEDPMRLSIATDLSDDPAYFRFGADLICYSRCRRGLGSARPDGALRDALAEVVINGTDIQLPFDVDDAVNNLHYERYAFGGRSGASRAHNSVVRQLYYLARPLLPVSIRKHLQRTSLKGRRNIPFPRWPVDHSVETLRERLLTLAFQTSGATQVPFIWFWPEGHSSCIIMTHDVETQRGLDFCPTLMDIDDAFGVKASFQLIPERRYHVSQGTLSEIKRRGFEVNVHDLNHDGHLFSDHATFLARASRINEYARKFDARGFRAGALYRNPDWFDAFEFSYDMSVPAAGHLDPQGGGCCSVMPFFYGDLLELPVTMTQDYSLFHILNDYSIELWKVEADAIQRKHGLISFITHPDYLIEKRAQNTYRDLLDLLARKRTDDNAWIALPGEVDRWWRERSHLKLVHKNGQWQIEGRGKERARVAFASLADGQVAYTVAPAS